MALPTCECLPGLYPNWKALGPIVAAARTWAGQSEDLACYEGRPIGEQLNALYCALLTVAGGGGGGATLLASFYIPEIVDSFERDIAAGYTGNGDADPFQREAAVDVLRSAHYQSGISGQLVILEDSPTPCEIIMQPATVTPGELEFSASYAAAAVAVSVFRYEYRIDAGSPVDNGTSLTLTDISASEGSHTLGIRAVSTSGVAGPWATSASFDVEAGAHPLLVNLISYWTLDEVSGVRDDSQGTNDITSNNAVGSTAGKIGDAAIFDGVNQSLSRANNASLQTGNIDYTLAGWFRIDVEQASQMIVARDEVGQREYAIDYASGVGLRFSINGFTFLANAGTLSFVGNPWYYVVCWHDAAADTINIQVNDGSVVSTSTGGVPQDATTSAFAMGARTYSGFEAYLNGALDEWGFWKRVLTSGERTSLYNGGAGLTYADF